MLGVVLVAVPSQPTDSRITRAWLALRGFGAVLLGVAALLGLWLARSLSGPLLALEQILDNLLANAVEASPPGHDIEVGVNWASA